jgi:hypothetical protein
VLSSDVGWAAVSVDAVAKASHRDGLDISGGETELLLSAADSPGALYLPVAGRVALNSRTMCRASQKHRYRTVLYFDRAAHVDSFLEFFAFKMISGSWVR